MTRVFVDSSAWLAMLLPRDRHNGEANRLFHSLKPSDVLVTSNYVLSETLTWLRYREPFLTAESLNDQVDTSSRLGLLDVVWINETVHRQGWDIMKRYRGQRLSHCDCCSFVICSTTPVDFVFTFDADFRAMGFEVKP